MAIGPVNYDIILIYKIIINIELTDSLKILGVTLDKGIT